MNVYTHTIAKMITRIKAAIKRMLSSLSKAGYVVPLFSAWILKAAISLALKPFSESFFSNSKMFMKSPRMYVHMDNNSCSLVNTSKKTFKGDENVRRLEIDFSVFFCYSLLPKRILSKENLLNRFKVTELLRGFFHN